MYGAAHRLVLDDTLDFMRKMVAQFDHVFLCADALDEANEDTRRELLEWFYLLCCSSPSARVFLTGRDYSGVLPRVSTIFTPELPHQQIPVAYIPITTQSNSRDLQAFLSDQIRNAKNSDDNERFLMDDNLEHEIVESLSSAT